MGTAQDKIIAETEENPKIGRAYMMDFMGWKKVRLLEIRSKDLVVQSSAGTGTRFTIKKDALKKLMIK